MNLLPPLRHQGMMDKSEANALTRLHAGDAHAFTRLMLDHADRLVRAAFMLCGDEALAHDLTQETFCRALAAAHEFRGDSRLYTWLYGILRRVCLERLRRDRRRSHLLQTYPPTLPVPPGPEETWRSDHGNAGLLKAVNELPVAQREIVRLRFVEEMKLAEIATVLNIPKGTVKSRLHNALAALRTRVSMGKPAHGEDPGEES